MENFWDYSVWGTLNVVAVLLASLLVGNILKKSVGFLKDSLVPISVIGGGILILVAWVYKLITGDIMFDTAFFGSSGTKTLEMFTYHCLALGFIASTLKTGDGKITKERAIEVFNTGVTTVSTYLLQGVCGMIITIVATRFFIPDFFEAAGVLLPFGYGQGTGQAMNYGGIYENDFGFDGGKSFGLTIAALGFLSASIGGVVHLNLLKRKGVITKKASDRHNHEKIEGENEIPMQESIDKMTVQIALIIVTYMITYFLMNGISKLIPGMTSLIFGFNFLFGVLSATLVKETMKFLKKKNAIQREYTNNFLLTRASNFFFDIMVVSGIAAIRLSVLEQYWGIMLILGIVGLFVTYFYNRYVAKTLFPKYAEEQFLMMYGMLTGTASTGTILLREMDGDFETPAADNMVYQNFPAIVFGFPMMLLAMLAPKKPLLTLGILLVFFIAMNILLFRGRIFKFKKKTKV
ncbi:MAG: hypothetical protein IJZ58_02660 [Oscillospiraceae bacterium]|nr:hypothetical protein [Oscillospiraceae bacterium]